MLHALNHWSTGKIIVFMNQYWWGYINKATKGTFLTCPTCLKYNSGKLVGTAPRHLKLPNGPLEVWQMDFIQLPLSHGYKYVLVTVCFHTRLKTSLADRLLSLLWIKSLWKKLSLPMEVLLNFTVIKEPILLGRYLEKPVLFAEFYSTFTVLTTLNPLVYSTALKALLRLLVKIVEALQIPWPKALPLVLLNLRFTPFGAHKISPFEMVIGFPIHLAPSSFDSQLTKGEILQHYKGLIASIKNNHALGLPWWCSG